jgi:hypothetical protein
VSKDGIQKFTIFKKKYLEGTERPRNIDLIKVNKQVKIKKSTQI